MRSHKLILSLLLVFILLTIKVSAQNFIKTESPYFLLAASDSVARQLVLKSTTVDARISGIVADVHVKQVYVYQGSKPVNATYVFPAPKSGLLYMLKVKVGRRVIEMRTVDLDVVNTKYGRYMHPYDDTMFVQSKRPSLYQVVVDSISTGKGISVELAYTEQIFPDSGCYHFNFPSIADVRTKKNSQFRASKSKLNLTVALNGVVAISSLKCNHSSVKIFKPNAQQVRCHLLQLNGCDDLDGFDLGYRLTGNSIKTGMLLYKGKRENYFLAMLQAPRKLENLKPLRREYLFVIDNGARSIYYNRQYLDSVITPIVKQLHSTDRFNILLTDSGSKFLSPSFLPATAEGLEQARQMIPDGRHHYGADLIRILKQAYPSTKLKNVSRNIILFTNGDFTIKDECYDLIQKNKDKANLFLFSASKNPNVYPINCLARKAESKSFIATTYNEVDSIMPHFVGYVTKPCLHCIQCRFEGFQAYDIQPVTLPDAFDDRPVLLFGKWKGAPSGVLHFKGEKGWKEFHQSIDVGKCVPSVDNSGLKYLWVKRKLESLYDSYELSRAEECWGKEKKLGFQYGVLADGFQLLAFNTQVSSSKKQLIDVRNMRPYGYFDAYLNEFYVVEIQGNICGGLFFEKKEVVFVKLEETPVYPGGMQEMRKYIAENIHYPEDAKENWDEGIVLVAFTVNDTGSIDDVKVLRSSHQSLNAEAVRLVSHLPQWKPAKQQGTPVPYRYTIPIHFKLFDQ